MFGPLLAVTVYGLIADLRDGRPPAPVDAPRVRGDGHRLPRRARALAGHRRPGLPGRRRRPGCSSWPASPAPSSSSPRAGTSRSPTCSSSPSRSARSARRAAGGAVSLQSAVLDASYASELGVALLLVVLAVRRAARKVDSAQGAALNRYADAQIDEATESERVRTDALVHDSVLTTFLSAAGAQTPEARALASRMAINAMNVLSRATVASHVGPKVPVRGPARPHPRRRGRRRHGLRFDRQDVTDHFVPGARSPTRSCPRAVQAMTNSVKHAGGPEVPRSVTVLGTAGGGVRVRIEDGGRGFDPKKIASERLGVRVSIYRAHQPRQRRGPPAHRDRRGHDVRAVLAGGRLRDRAARRRRRGGARVIPVPKRLLALLAGGVAAWSRPRTARWRSRAPPPAAGRGRARPVRAVLRAVGCSTAGRRCRRCCPG